LKQVIDRILLIGLAGVGIESVGLARGMTLPGMADGALFSG
jgi:hypothetical protein